MMVMVMVMVVVREGGRVGSGEWGGKEEEAGGGARGERRGRGAPDERRPRRARALAHHPPAPAAAFYLLLTREAQALLGDAVDVGRAVALRRVAAAAAVMTVGCVFRCWEGKHGAAAVEPQPAHTARRPARQWQPAARGRRQRERGAKHAQHSSTSQQHTHHSSSSTHSTAAHHQAVRVAREVGDADVVAPDDEDVGLAGRHLERAALLRAAREGGRGGWRSKAVRGEVVIRSCKQSPRPGALLLAAREEKEAPLPLGSSCYRARGPCGVTQLRCARCRCGVDEREGGSRQGTYTRQAANQGADGRQVVADAARQRRRGGRRARERARQGQRRR